MSESKKLLIGFLMVGLICCCLAGAAFLVFRNFGKNFESMANGDPTQLAKVEDKIVGFDVPPGYTPIALSMFVYDMVYLTPVEDKDGSLIMLMQFNGPTAGNPEQMEEQFRKVAEQQNDKPGMSLSVVDSFEEVIRGQTVTVTVSEGNYQGITMRQWITFFQGNNGIVYLLIQGPVEGWDEELVDDFIKSIR